MVSWQGTDSCFNNDEMKIGDIEMITSAYFPSKQFGSRVGSKYIGHDTYTGRRSNLQLKPTAIYGPVQKYYLNYS